MDQLSALSLFVWVSLLHKYMLFAGWEVRNVKNSDPGIENTARGPRPRAAI